MSWLIDAVNQTMKLSHAISGEPRQLISNQTNVSKEKEALQASFLSNIPKSFRLNLMYIFIKYKGDR